MRRLLALAAVTSALAACSSADPRNDFDEPPSSSDIASTEQESSSCVPSGCATLVVAGSGNAVTTAYGCNGAYTKSLYGYCGDGQCAYGSGSTYGSGSGDSGWVQENVATCPSDCAYDKGTVMIDGARCEGSTTTTLSHSLGNCYGSCGAGCGGCCKDMKLYCPSEAQVKAEFDINAGGGIVTAYSFESNRDAPCGSGTTAITTKHYSDWGGPIFGYGKRTSSRGFPKNNVQPGECPKTDWYEVPPVSVTEQGNFTWVPAAATAKACTTDALCEMHDECNRHDSWFKYIECQLRGFEWGGLPAAAGTPNSGWGLGFWTPSGAGRFAGTEGGCGFIITVSRSWRCEDNQRIENTPSVTVSADKAFKRDDRIVDFFGEEHVFSHGGPGNILGQVPYPAACLVHGYTH